MSKTAIIYTKSYCPYCVKAKMLLSKHNINIIEIDVTDDSNLQNEMIEKSGGRKTVPQIFINSEHIGGCDDLEELIKAKKL